MNKYVTDYDTCIAMIQKPVVLASAFSDKQANGKELIYNPLKEQLEVFEFSLIPGTTPDVEQRYYCAGLDAFCVKRVDTQIAMYDLSEAIDAYNEIKIQKDWE